MGTNLYVVKSGLKLLNAATGNAPVGQSGVLFYNTTLGKFQYHNGSSYLSVADLASLASTTDGSAGADLVGGENKSYSNISGLTTYTVQDFLDRIDAALGVSGGSSFSDAAFEVYDDVDNTKIIKLQASGISTATTRTLTMPDANVDLGNLTNSNISPSAAIVYSKLDLTNAIVNADISASAAIAYSKLALTGSVVNADISASAAIAYSKLALTGSIVNADVSASAAIAYSKLDLAGSIVNADISASAAIAYSKLALTNSIVNADIASGAAIDAAKIHDGSVSNTEFGYLNGVTSAIQTQLNDKANDADVVKKDGSVAFTADQSMGGNKLTNLATPTTGSDAATKQYVDDVALGLKPKQAVRVATTAAGTLASSFENGDTVDGVVLATGDRILIKDQAAPAENGIYVVQASGAPVRAADFDSLSPIDEVNGAFVAVQSGTDNAGKIFVQQGVVSTIGTDPINFVFFNSSASLVGGDGITVSGNNISVDHDGEGLQFLSNQLALELDGATLSKSASGLKVADGGITNTQVNASAAIAYSKLALTGSIVNADISASAAIAYSKLNLANSVVNADIASGAAIDAAKIHDGSVSNTEFGYLNGVTSDIQTQLNSKLENVVEDTTPQLGGTLDLNSQAISGVMRRGADATNAVQEEYFDSLSISSSTTAVLTSFTFDSRDFKACQVEIMVNNGNNRRFSKIMVVCDNAATVASSNVSLVEVGPETADVGLTWSAAINGNNVEISYTSGAGTYGARADVKRFRA